MAMGKRTASSSCVARNRVSLTGLQYFSSSVAPPSVESPVVESPAVAAPALVEEAFCLRTSMYLHAGPSLHELPVVKFSTHDAVDSTVSCPCIPHAVTPLPPCTLPLAP